MPMTINQLVTGPTSLRAPTPDALGARASSRNGGSPTELARAPNPGAQANATAAASIERASAQLEAPELARAVEEANALAAAHLRTANRSVTFGRHESTGRITITIHEEVDGEQVERQIPSESLLKLIERLRALGPQSSRATTGSLVETKA